MGDRADGGYLAILAEVEAEPCAVVRVMFAFHGKPGARRATSLAPDAERLERPVEFHPEPRGIAAAAAEADRGHLPLHGAVADDMHLATDYPMPRIRLADVDQYVASARIDWEGVTLRRRSGERRRFGIDAAMIGQAHLVIACLSDLAFMRVPRPIALVIEALGIARIEIAARPDRAGHRQHRDLPTLLPAAGTGNEGVSEAEDLFVVVAPARVVGADRTD